MSMWDYPDDYVKKKYESMIRQITYEQKRDSSSEERKKQSVPKEPETNPLLLLLEE